MNLIPRDITVNDHKHVLKLRKISLEINEITFRKTRMIFMNN